MGAGQPRHPGADAGRAAAGGNPAPRRAAGPARAPPSRRPLTAAPTPAPSHPGHPPTPTGRRPSSGPGAGRRPAHRRTPAAGQMPIEARFDLHGHTLAGGQRAVTAFVAQSFAAGRRCVLIITGKGNRQADGRRAPGV